MAKRLDPRHYPDYTQRKVVDDTMGRLDLHGLSRRDFLAFASASVIAGATAASFGARPASRRPRLRTRRVPTGCS